MTPLATALTKLRDAGGILPASRLTTAQKRQLENWGRRSGGVTEQRSGTGTVFAVPAGRDRALALALADLAPGLDEQLADDLDPRARNLAMSRSTKAGTRQAQHLLLPLKPLGPGSLWSSDADGFSIADACRHTGATLLPIRPEDSWITAGELWLVENQALFDRVDWAPVGVAGSMTYFAGELNARLLAWLASVPRASKVVLFADYDANGLCNYERLVNACASPVELHLFEGWQDALAKYGNRDLHRANLPALEAVIGRLGGEAAAATAPLVTLMRHLGLSLEQEAIWLAPSKTGPSR